MPPTPESLTAPSGSSADRGAAGPKPKVDWQTAMKRAIRSQADLRRYLGLEPNPISAEEFPTFVPLELADRIRPGDPADPIAIQVLASTAETLHRPDESSDPVGDMAANAAEGVLHKYEGRVLIVTHGACAVHCRYCFRREFPYADVSARKKRWEPALEYIRGDESVTEVILSGGDPLTLLDHVLDDLISAIESVPHVRRLRIHTRLPIAIPQRVTEDLVDRLGSSPLSTWMVLHTNHAREIDNSVAQSLSRLRRAGITLLNQSVLLAGVNDSTDALVDLSNALIDLGVQPYYLHQLDRVRGTGHFWVDIERGKQMLSEMRVRLPGYAIPCYVFEQAGQKSKTPIA